MGLTNKSKAKQVKQERTTNVQDDVSHEFHILLDKFHKMNIQNDNEIELAFLEDRRKQITSGKSNLHGQWDNSLPTFSPSSASKSDRDLVFKLSDAPKDNNPYEPYQTRWVKNGSAVHERMQKDFLYMEKHLKYERFSIYRTKTGAPAWERNVRTVRQFEHNGEKFQIYGMVDGILLDKQRDKLIGYDLKTKSTTIACVGDYMLKVPQESHVEQMIAYSLLFDVDEYIIHYESLAKDGWSKGVEARPDMKVFHIKITDSMRTSLLDKFARVTKYYCEDILPPREPEREFFSEYKELNKRIEENGK